MRSEENRLVWILMYFDIWFNAATIWIARNLANEMSIRSEPFLCPQDESGAIGQIDLFQNSTGAKGSLSNNYCAVIFLECPGDNFPRANRMSIHQNNHCGSCISRITVDWDWCAFSCAVLFE